MMNKWSMNIWQKVIHFHFSLLWDPSLCPEWLHSLVVRTGEAGHKYDKTGTYDEESFLNSIVCKKVINMKIFIINSLDN